MLRRAIASATRVARREVRARSIERAMRRRTTATRRGETGRIAPIETGERGRAREAVVVDAREREARERTSERVTDDDDGAMMRGARAQALYASVRASSGGVVTNLENATGLYKAELEGKMRGEDIFDHHAFLRAPTGTEESPCVVESTMEYRVVGSPDPDDDSIIHWGRLEEGAPPMKIGSEWFVHKRVPGGGHH